MKSLNLIKRRHTWGSADSHYSIILQLSPTLLRTKPFPQLGAPFPTAEDGTAAQARPRSGKGSFKEARAALSRSGITSLPSNQTPVKVDAVSATPVTGAPSTYLSSGNVSIGNRQPISAGNVASATVKMESVPVSSMVAGPAFPHNSSVPRSTSTSQGVPSFQTSSPSSASQDIVTSNENANDTKPVISMVQPICPVNPAQENVNILNNLSQARQAMNSTALSGGTSMGLQSMGQTPVAMHMSNMISSRMASSVPVAQ